jgi:hypothetical protein
MKTKDDFTSAGLRRMKFEGFETIGSLRRTDFEAVPSGSGVYAVLRPDLAEPIVLSVSSGGRWKRKDPNVPLPLLEAAWLRDAYVLYFGQGKSLRDRIALYLAFGAGQNVMHYGGRYLWHLDRTEDFIVAWWPCERPRVVEQALIVLFRTVYGDRPFANLQD